MKIHISSQVNKDKAIRAVHDLSIGGNYLVEIEEQKEETRRIKQNNLWYHWIGEFKNEKKWSEKHIRGFLKYHYALPIMRRSKKHNVLLKMFDSVADNTGSNKDLHLALVLPMTSKFNVKEMHELLSETQRIASMEHGIYLTDIYDLMNG